MANILDLYTTFGLTPKKVSNSKGGEYAGPCPGCGGEDRFRIWPADNDGEGSYWCRQPGNGCGKGGDVIQFLIDFRSMSYKQACAELDRPAGEQYRIPARRPQPRIQNKPFTPAAVDHPAGVDAAIWQQKATALAAHAHENLLKNRQVLAWLGARGIDEPAACRHHLGWLPDNFFRPRPAWGLSEVKQNGRSKKLFIPAGLVIPWRQDEIVIRLRVRRSDDAGAQKYGRYFAVPGSNMQPYVIGADRKAQTIVETELDAIMIDCQAGDLTGADAMGSVAVKPDRQLHQILSRALAILVALDGDAAGESAWPWWQKNYRRARRLQIPAGAGKDPGEAYQAGIDIPGWIKAALPPVFRVGPCPGASESKKGRPAKSPPPPARKPSPPPDQPEKPGRDQTPIPDAIDLLQSMLAQYPVSIICNPRQLSIQYHPGWNNDTALEEISNLVFFNSDVFEYLHQHPAEVITAKNFLKGFF